MTCRSYADSVIEGQDTNPRATHDGGRFAGFCAVACLLFYKGVGALHSVNGAMQADPNNDPLAHAG